MHDPVLTGLKKVMTLSQPHLVKSHDPGDVSLKENHDLCRSGQKKVKKSAEIFEICKFDDFELIISVKRFENG